MANVTLMALADHGGADFGPAVDCSAYSRLLLDLACTNAAGPYWYLQVLLEHGPDPNGLNWRPLKELGNFSPRSAFPIRIVVNEFDAWVRVRFHAIAWDPRGTTAGPNAGTPPPVGLVWSLTGTGN